MHIISNKSLLLIAVSILILIIFATSNVFSQGSLYLNWFVYSNPSPLDERPFSVCLLGNYIYVVGYDATKINSGYRIEKRLRDNGELVKVWQYNPTVREDVLFDCLVLNSTIYVVGVEGVLIFPSAVDFGTVVIISLDPDLNMLKYFKTNITGFASSITTDGLYIYVGGFYVKGVDRGMFIAKFNQRLELVKLVFYNPSPVGDYIYQIKYDRISDAIWIVGVESEMYALIAYVDRDLTYKEPVRVLSKSITGYAISIDFDGNGNKYVLTYGLMGDRFTGFVKLDKNNNLVATSSKYYGDRVVWAWGVLYVIQTGQKVVVTALDSNLNEVYTYTVNESTYCSQYLLLGNVAFDENNLYFATGICPAGNSGWGIYSIKLAIQLRYRTVTEMRIFTVTRTVEKTATVTSTMVLPTTITKTVEQTIVQTQTIEKINIVTLPQNFTETTTITQTVSASAFVTITSTVTRNVETTVYRTIEKTLTKTPLLTTTVTVATQKTVTQTATIITMFHENVNSIRENILLLIVITSLVATGLVIVLRKARC